jgi:DNA repair protein RadC
MNYPENQQIELFGIKKDSVIIPEIKIQYNSKEEVKGVKIISSREAANFVRNLFEKDTIEVQEQFFILYLNRKNQIKGYYKHSVGGISSTTVDIRLILSAALKSLTTAIIMVHNHPSGNARPSDADIFITKRIKDAGKLLEISLLDSIVITTDDYYSFADEGRLSGMGVIAEKHTSVNKRKVRTIEQSVTNDMSMKSVNNKPKKVKNLSEEVKFIRRFVGLHNKVKSPNAVLTFIKSLQKSITQKLISKSSPFVKEIYYIQDNLIEFYNRMKGEMRILLEEKTLPKLAAISGGEEVYPSVGFIKSFIGMQGKVIPEEKKELYVKRLHNAAKNRKIYPDDPFVDKLQRIYNYLKGIHKPGQKIAFEKAELSGLACICNAHTKAMGNIYDTKGKSVRKCRSGKYSDAKRGACSYNKGLKKSSVDIGQIFETRRKNTRKCRSGKYSDAGRGACSYNKGLAGIMTAEEVANMKFDLLPFSGDWEKLIGKPEKNFSMMIHGEPGAGKTVLLLKFTKYLSSLGSVLYMTSEEFGSATLTEKVNKYLNPIPSNVTFASKLGITNIGDYRFVIFDSITDLKISLQEFKSFKEAYPNTAFILIMQNTKGGLFKGGKDWEHEVQIVGEVENGIIQIYKNRYGNKGSMNFFDKK